MTTRITCPACDAAFTARDTLAGRAIKCPRCKGPLAIPGPRLPQSHAYEPEETLMSFGVAGGIALILLAVAWFVAGWFAGVIYFYPPVLAILGVITIFKSKGERDARARRAERAARRRMRRVGFAPRAR